MLILYIFGMIKTGTAVNQQVVVFTNLTVILRSSSQVSKVPRILEMASDITGLPAPTLNIVHLLEVAY